MSIIRFGGCVAALGLLLAPDGRAQASSSASYALADFTLDGVGGGTASLGFAAHVTVGAVTGGVALSPGYRGALGILETANPVPGTGPVFFGITPDFGPKAGGTTVFLTGLNLNAAGLGFTVDGASATGVSALSPTAVTGTVPAGTFGPKSVAVSTVNGSDSSAEAWTYTPAVRTTQFSRRKAQVTIRDYGPTGNLFWVFASLTTTFGNTKFGPLLIGPNVLVQLLPLMFYPSPDGIHSITFTVPDDPILDGVTIYFQSLDITQISPLQGKLTNRSQTTFP